jgi:hypothetical protein
MAELEPPTFNAILVSGRCKNWWHCIDSIKRNIIESLKEKSGVPTVKVFASVDASHEETDRIDELFESLGVEAAHREAFFDTHDFKGRGNYHHGDCIKHYPSMCYHNKMSFSLLQDHLWQNPTERVGWVVYTRPDLQPAEPVEFPRIPERDALYHLDSADWYRHIGGPYWVPDQFEAGDFETMRKYCSIFDYIHSTAANMPPKICDQRQGFGENFTCPEREIGKYVLERWRIKKMPIECRYQIPPR